MIIKENSLWVEKYRPQNLNFYIGNLNLKHTIQKQLDSNDIQNYLFYGSAGTGKTTLAKLIVNNLDCDWLYINSSDERGIDTIRDKVVSFASTMSFAPLKVIILDEADFLTIQAQASLRNIIETYSKSTRFILTCNFIERIIDPIQSRCQTYKIIPPSKGEIALQLLDICEKEEVKCSKENIVEIINKFYPDIRKMINTLQSSNINGEIKLDKSISIHSNYISDVIEELKQPKPKFNIIRQIIANSGIEDFDEMYRTLYDRASEFAPNKEGSVSILVNEHLFQRSFRIDQEICLMSLISNLINLK